MKKMIDLTLGIPTYNSSRYLDDLFSALGRLTVFPQCILFTDNCSTDDTVARLERFRVDNPDLYVRIHINSANLGIAGNYNQLVRKTFETRWIQILDSDDYLLGDYYRDLTPALGEDRDVIVTSMRTSSPVVDAYVRTFERTMQATRLREIPSFVQVLGSACSRSCLIYKTDAIRRNEFIDPIFDGSDIIHTDQFMKRNLYWPAAKLFYRIHPASTTSRLESARDKARHDHERYLGYVRHLPLMQRMGYTADFMLRKKIGSLIRRS